MKNIAILALILICLSPLLAAAADGKDAAQKQLESMKIPYTAASFVAEAGKGNTKAVELFLAAGMSINSTNGDEGVTPLIAACNSGQKAVVDLLLSKNADINLGDADDTAPLIAASVNGNADIVSALLTKGAIVNASDVDDKTALMFAAEKGHPEIVKLLIEKGADIDYSDDDDDTAMTLAKQNKHDDIVALLQAGKPKQQPQSQPQAQTKP